MKKVIHIITGLGSGGAENMLYKLVRHSNKNLFQHEIISLIDEGTVGEKIKAEGVRIHSININKKNALKSLFKIRKICKEFDVINTWLYHSDIIGFLIKVTLQGKKIIWNIRHSNLEKEENKPRTLRIIKINSIISKYINAITYNSNQAYKNHLKIGYQNKNSVVIDNGFELDRFTYDYENKLKVRSELNLSMEETVFITVGRWNIQKDYLTLMKALNEVKSNNIEFKMIMVGEGLNIENTELAELISNYRLGSNIILLGRRGDIPELLSASDVYISSSSGESFSNSIGEAMACELPCVVTDAGDSEEIVSNTGEVVKVRDYYELSIRIMKMVQSNDLERLGILARKRIIDNYDIKKVVKDFESLYLNT